jgi:hypothetical protein
VRNVKVSNEIVIVLLLVVVAIIFSIVVFIRQNPMLTLAIIGAVVLYKSRHKIHFGRRRDVVEQ